MELSFVVAAVRRRPWIVLIFTALGALPFLLPRLNDTPTYRAQAVVLVSPSSESDGATGTGTDRYVINQVSVLRSRGIAERVAELVGDGETATGVSAAVRIEQRPGTDLVDVFAVAANPNRARDIANGYVESYLDDLQRRADEIQQPGIDSLEEDLDAVSTRIGELNREISELITAFPRGAGEFPSAEVAAPEVAAQRNALVSQYDRLLDKKTQLELSAAQRVTSELVQPAATPNVPEPGPRRLLLYAGAFAGAMLGVCAAVLAARLSKGVLDAVHAEEILGSPLTYNMPRVAGVARRPASALKSLPDNVVAGMDQICVRAEAAATLGSSLTIAVVGSQRGAGATTLALAISGRYANRGSEVVLVDADPRSPDISRMFKGARRLTIPTLLAAPDGGADTAPSTGVAGVRMVGQSLSHQGFTLRRELIGVLLSAASRNVNVVIVDGGPVLDSASTVQLCQQVDAVVLAVPAKHQGVDALEAVARVMSERRGELFPVLTRPGRGGLLARLRQRQSAPAATRGAAGEAKAPSATSAKRAIGTEPSGQPSRAAGDRRQASGQTRNGSSVSTTDQLMPRRERTDRAATLEPPVGLEPVSAEAEPAAEVTGRPKL